MRFSVEFNATLEADDIDDAFRRLGHYYTALSENEDEDASSPFTSPTEIHIRPVEEQQP